jgi:hypothetical protein
MLPGLSGRKPLREVFDDDARDLVLQNLWFRAEHGPELASLPGHELLMIYANWKVRLIDPRPRRVHRSSALLANARLGEPPFTAAADQIARMLELGLDVTPHLSRRIREGYEPQAPSRPKRLTARADLDMLLNDWGLHHLHLSLEREADGFTKRTRPVLIAAVKRDDVYLVDIIEHGEWTNDRLVRVMAHEWPDAGLVREVKGVLADSQVPTPAQRKKLRDSGMTSYVTIADATYIAGIISSAGYSAYSSIEVDTVRRNLDWFCRQMDEDPRYAVRTMASMGVLPKSDLDLHFEVFADGGYGIVERKTGFRFRLAN